MTERPQSPDPDATLVSACQSIDGDTFEAAFESLYLRYKDRVYSIAYRITGTTNDAMDVVQDSFSVLFRRISTFQSQSRFSTWLFRIVVNASIDHKRRERSRGAGQLTSLHQLDAQIEPPDPSGSPSGNAESLELGDHVHLCLQRVSPKLRAALVLRYLEGLSYEQLADTLQVSIGTVKSRLARAHVAIERVLSGTLAPFGYPDAGAGRVGSNHATSSASIPARADGNTEGVA